MNDLTTLINHAIVYGDTEQKNLMLHRALELVGTLDTIRFHLRRNDHVTEPTGPQCTMEILSAIDKALDQSTQEDAEGECEHEWQEGENPVAGKVLVCLKCHSFKAL